VGARLLAGATGGGGGEAAAAAAAAASAAAPPPPPRDTFRTSLPWPDPSLLLALSAARVPVAAAAAGDERLQDMARAKHTFCAIASSDKRSVGRAG
jgi:hypothetical protein